MAEWTWEPDDFAALWYSDAHDRIPSPLRYTSRFALRDEFAAHRRAVLDRYTADELEEIQLALHTLGTSELRIEILGGTSKHKNSTGPDDLREYRIIGARNAYHAVTLMQGGTATEHGPIRVRLFGPESLPARIVQSIPSCAPGGAAPATFHPDDLAPRRDGHLEDATHQSPRERYQRLLGRPADGGGTAVLLTAPLHTHAQPSNVLQWHDITGDGRYTELRGSHITVRPTAPADLATQFTAWIDRARKRLEDAREDAW
ncbi:ESAT-6 protein secretion system EspG family protein [Nocardia tenerifensis]|uniref:ESAT-6 protein secretion system EspG family protein n=1 Tax=Nocardia tenerifensis TaxID=228006 RepID=A0A318JU66_9NOCA|nr:ESX secretion-associated protein EspG [Nocardia tenerifensis]PXX60284.1 ESAT-6 protein secretion system EspG family protein [Nocardia tenerifensis]